MSLETKSLSELRSIIQGMEMNLDWSWTKSDIIQRIRRKTDQVVQRPQVSVEPEDQRLRTVPPARGLPQSEVFEALKKYRDCGLIVTFPTPDSVYMRFDKREDTSTLRTYLRVIDDCAKKVLYG